MKSKSRLKQDNIGYLFILPNVLLFLLFFVTPLLLSVYYSFTSYDGWSNPEWIGFDNYIRMFTDSEFWSVLGRTFLYVFLSVPTVYISSLFTAYLLSQGWMKAKSFLRGSVFWPTMISTIIVGIVFRWLFGEGIGIINYLLNLIGLDAIPWLTNPYFAMITIVVATIWSRTGFFMVIFIAALGSIPESYYEAARLDGATAWEMFRYITLPLIKPTSFLVIILSFINSFKAYPMILSLTGGGPAGRTTFIVQYIYNTGFQRNNIGYASTVSLVMFVILAGITAIQFRINRGGEN